MSVRKVVLFIISWVILGAVVFTFLQAARHPQLSRIRVAFKDKCGVLFDNLVDSVFPPRRPPLTIFKLQENLRLNLPVPFANFSQEDWQRFWHLFYGTYIVDSRGWPRRERQLNKQEAQDALVDYYSQPFGSFSQQHWDIFWRDILERKVFK